MILSAACYAPLRATRVSLQTVRSQPYSSFPSLDSDLQRHPHELMKKPQRLVIDNDPSKLGGHGPSHLQSLRTQSQKVGASIESRFITRELKFIYTLTLCS
jgi:hypothetical protein